MKVLKPRTFIVFAFAALSGALLLYTSQNVQDAQSRLDGYERSIESEKEKIRLLRAEWASLNRPERLERLANEFLDVLPPAPDQMVDRDAANFEIQPAVEFEVERDFEPVLQPVSAGGEVKSHTAPPAPKTKPPAPSREFREQEKKESKDFNKLIGEIGGRP